MAGKDRPSRPARARAGADPDEAPGTVYQDKHGQWWASIGSGKDRRTRRCPQSQNTERTARRLLAELQAERRAKKDARSGRQTVAAFAQARITKQAADLSPKALHFEQQMLDLYLLPILGNKRLDRVDAEDIDHLLEKLRKLERADNRPGPLSERTIRHAFNAGKRLFDEAVRRRAILWNPFDAHQAPRVVTEEKAPLPDAAIVALLTTVRDHPSGSLARLYPICCSCLVLGLRQGEVLGLRRRDYDPRARTLMIAQQVQTVGGKTGFAPPKTQRSARTIPVPAWLCEVLDTHLAMLDAADVTSDLLFPSDAGTPIIPRNLARDYYTAQRYAGLAGWSFHQLRHTAATRLAATGASQAIIAGVLGHALPGVTGLYTHSEIEAMRPWVEVSAQALRRLIEVGPVSEVEDSADAKERAG